MSGPAGYSEDRDAADVARELLDATARTAATWAAGQRALLADLLEMVPSCATATPTSPTPCCPGRCR